MRVGIGGAHGRRIDTGQCLQRCRTCKQGARRVQRCAAGTGCQQGSDKTVIVSAQTKVDGLRNILVGIITTDQPFECAAEGFALQTQFVGHGVDRGIAIGKNIENVQSGEIRIIGFFRPEFAIGTDIDQVGAVADRKFDFAGHTPLIIGRVGSLIRGCNPVIRSALHGDRIKRAHCNIGSGHAAAGTEAYSAKETSCFNRRLQDLDCRTAACSALRIVCNQTTADAARRFEAELAAKQILIGVVGITYAVAGAVDDINIAVSLPVCTGYAQRQSILDQGSVDRALEAHMVEIAIGRVYETTEIVEVRPYVGDVQGACRGVASEQCTLRAAEDLDAFNVDKFAKRNAGTGLIGTVDKDTDSGFKADVIGRRTDTANTQNNRSGRRLRVGGREA